MGIEKERSNSRVASVCCVSWSHGDDDDDDDDARPCRVHVCFARGGGGQEVWAAV